MRTFVNLLCAILATALIVPTTTALEPAKEGTVVVTDVLTLDSFMAADYVCKETTKICTSTACIFVPGVVGYGAFCEECLSQSCPKGYARACSWSTSLDCGCRCVKSDTDLAVLDSLLALTLPAGG